MFSYRFLHTSIGQPAKTYIHQLCADTECSLEDLLTAKTDRERWQERFMGIHVVGMP